MRTLCCLGLLSLFTVLSCKTQVPSVPTTYEADIEAWRGRRLANLTAPTGWLSLTGLYWLKEGVNECGTSAEARIKLTADAPALAATYTLDKGEVECEITAGSGVETRSDDDCAMAYGSQRWQLLERGGRHGVRVRDTLLPARIRLRPIEQFAIDPSYRVYGEWEAVDGADSVLMRNVLDMEYYVPVEGKLRFTIDDQLQELIALDGGPDDLFLIFADKTTGETTYGGGRYLYCPRPDEDGRTIIDFNKAYNPPCAFTDFATCLLPRVENNMPVAIWAGEKTYGDH
ncbi:MAG: DUF1684 domain-containing protein [Bacteroidota bacterium]